MFGLSTTGLSRQQLASRAAVDQQMEEARALNYDNLVLSDTDAARRIRRIRRTPTTGWTRTRRPTIPTERGPLAAEPIVRVAGASPALQHYQNPLARRRHDVRGLSLRDLGRLAAGRHRRGDAADGNNDGVNDGTAHDAKRVTVVVVWNDELGRGSTSLSESSLFSDGQIVYKAPTHERRARGRLPDRERGDKTVTFTANASDSDGSIASVTGTSATAPTGTGSVGDPHVRELRRRTRS